MMRVLAFLAGGSMMVYQAWAVGTVNGLTLLGSGLLAYGALGLFRKLTNADDR